MTTRTTTLYDRILSIYPELVKAPEAFYQGVILLQDDSDGNGPYIKEWNHPTLAQPTEAQLHA